MKNSKLTVKCILGFILMTVQTPAWGSVNCNILLSPDFGAAALFYFAYCASILLFVIGIIVLPIAVFVIKLRRIAGKIVFGIGFLFLCPFGCFVVDSIQTKNEEWDDLGPMLQAIDKNKFDNVNKLIQSGYNVNENRDNVYYSTPLTYATSKGNIRIVQLLVENGADVNLKANMGGVTPLHAAIHKKDTAVVSYLLEHGVDTFLDNEAVKPIYPLQMAICLSDWRDPPTLLASRDVVETLLKHGAAPNACSPNELTPLQEAMSRKNYEVIRLLLVYGADANAASNRYLTPLQGAVAQQNYEMVRCLLEHGADVNATSNNMLSPLQEVIFKQDQEDEMERIIKENSDTMTTQRYKSLIELAEMAGNKDILDLLLKYAQ
jgi:ankyrin